MAKPLWGALVSLFLGVSPGCGGNGGGGDLPGADADVAGEGAEVTEEPMRLFANATCEKLGECAPSFLRIYAGDVSACKAREHETMKPVRDLPGLGANWAGCGKAMEAMACGAFLRVVRGETTEVAACELDPTLGDGEPCTHPYQCTGRICARPVGARCGTCASPLAAGAACDGNYLVGSPCGPGSTCADGKCVALGDTGAPCDPASAPCFADLGCVDGRCGPPRQVDDACSSLAGECDLYVQGLVCHPGTGKCTALTLAGAGEACGLTEFDATACRQSNCYPSLLAGTCVAQASDGGACDAEAGPDCQFHAHCVGGRCEPFFTAVCP